MARAWACEGSCWSCEIDHPTTLQKWKHTTGSATDHEGVRPSLHPSRPLPETPLSRFHLCIRICLRTAGHRWAAGDRRLKAFQMRSFNRLAHDAVHGWGNPTGPYPTIWGPGPRRAESGHMPLDSSYQPHQLSPSSEQTDQSSSPIQPHTPPP